MLENQLETVLPIEPVLELDELGEAARVEVGAAEEDDCCTGVAPARASLTSGALFS